MSQEQLTIGDRGSELLKRSFRGAQAGEGPHAEQHNPTQTIVLRFILLCFDQPHYF